MGKQLIHIIRTRLSHCAACLLLILPILTACPGCSDTRQAELPRTYLVKQGDFTVEITESGVLQTLNSVTISSGLPSNKAKIIELVEEGSYVKQGDLLVAFDPSPFLEDIRKSELNIQEAEGILAQAKEDSRLQEAKNTEQISDMLHAVKVAGLDLENLKQGKIPLQEEETKTALLQAETEWQQARQAYQDLKDIFDSGFVTRKEMEDAERKARQTESSYELAREKLQLLTDSIWPAEIAKAEAELNKRKEELANSKQTAMMIAARNQAVVQRAQSKLDAEKAALEETKGMLARTTITAPSPGFVIFNPVPIQGEERKVQIGDSIWVNQGFIILPDISRMGVAIKVREVDINKIAKGQPARISINAYPDLALNGTVDVIGSLAKSEDEKEKWAKYFSVRVLVDTFDERLRPGMTARVSILAQQLHDVIAVPVETVFTHEGKNYCVVADSATVKGVEVETGISNNDFVLINKGLQAGDAILLHLPEGFAFP